MNKLLKQNFNSFFIIFISIVIILGIYLRLNIYLKGIPLWMDELGFSMVIANRKLYEVFYSTWGIQKPPLLFMLFSYINTLITGVNVYTLRFLPFISSICSLFAFFTLLKNNIKSKLLIISGMILLCFNTTVIYYAQEFKTYSSDILITLLLLILYEKFEVQKSNRKYLIMCFLVGFIFSLFSFSTLYIIPAIITVELIKSIKPHKTLIALFTGYLCANLYTFMILKDVIKNEIKLDFWQSGYLQLNWNSFYEIFNNFYHFAFPLFNINSYIILSLIILGMVVFIITKNKIGYVMVITVLYAIFGSLIKFYPLTGRTIIYFIPFLILFIIKSFDLNKGTISFIVKYLFIITLSYYLFFLSKAIFQNQDTIIMYSPIKERMEAKEGIFPLLNQYRGNERVLVDATIFDIIKYYNCEGNFYHNLKITITYSSTENTTFEELEKFLNQNEKEEKYIALSYINIPREVFAKIEEYFYNQNINYKIISSNNYMRIYKIPLQEKP